MLRFNLSLGGTLQIGVGQMPILCMGGGKASSITMGCNIVISEQEIRAVYKFIRCNIVFMRRESHSSGCDLNMGECLSVTVKPNDRNANLRPI